MDARVRMIWYGDHGEIFFAWGECTDVSRSGMQIELDSYTIVGPEMRSVTFRFAGPVDFGGSATVRHRTQQGTKTIVGLEFNDGLEWSPELDAASELTRLARVLREGSTQPVAMA